MTKNILTLNKSWRGVKQLLATFLCLSLIAVSCKKKDNLVGSNVLPNGTILNTEGVDTFSLTTYSVSEDSIPSTNPSNNLLGSYVDPVFGNVDASFYTQVNISNLNPQFGGDIKIDSIVFAMVYSGYYGNLDDQTVEVYQITEDFEEDKKYYPFNDLNYDQTDLVFPNTGTFSPDPVSLSVVDEDSVAAQLRIHLDTNFARNLINEAINGSAFSSEETFKDYLKGFYVKTNNMQSVDEGAILYFNNNSASSNITIYYRENINGIYQTFSYTLLINPTDIDFNHVEMDQTGTPVEQSIENPTVGSFEFYAQSYTTRAKVEFPSISNIEQDAIVQEAILTLPVEYYTNDLKYPSNFVSIATQLDATSDDLALIQSGITYDNARKAYVIDLRNYVQRVVKGEIENNGIVISPTFFNTSAERIIFNGPNTPNKQKPKLNILITDN